MKTAVPKVSVSISGKQYGMGTAHAQTVTTLCFSTTSDQGLYRQALLDIPGDPTMVVQRVRELLEQAEKLMTREAALKTRGAMLADATRPVNLHLVPSVPAPDQC